MISAEDLLEFKRIWKKEFNEEISDEKALDRAIKLLTLVRIVYKPMTQADYEALEKRRRETS